MDLEKEIFEFWKETSPSSAFSEGVESCAGKLFLPTDKNRRRALAEARALIRRAKDEKTRKFLKVYETSLAIEELDEPHHAPEEIMGTFFNYMVKEGFNEKHLSSLADDSSALLIISLRRLSKKKWPVEIKIMTMNEAGGAAALLKTVEKEVKSAELKKKISRLIKELIDYRQAFGVRGIKNGDFSEAFPIMKKQGGKLGRKKYYPVMLKDFRDFPESAGQIEKKATGWLNSELVHFKKITVQLAKIYKCRPTAEAVEEQIKKRGKLKGAHLVKTNKEARAVLQKIAGKEFVKIAPGYDTRLIETPDYMVNFITTAAMNSLDSFTKKPFNIFFVTTSKKGSPVSDIADLMNTLSHEEYGHCVNFSNTARQFAGKLGITERISSGLSL
ncbi:MAG: hypothetical protein V1911_01510, partial [Candidatus Micrarchaeota archaeon]